MKIPALLFIVCMGILIVFPRVSVARWQPTNWTTGGFVQSLTVNGTILFAGTDGVGVFMTRNDGDSWAPVNSGLTTKYIPALLGGGKNVFAGTTSGVFLSTNTGETWTAMNPAFMNKYIQSLAAYGANLFAGTTNGLFLTTNNGTSWSRASNGLTDTTVYSLLISGYNLYAGTNNGVYVSPNNGATWTPVNEGLKNTIVYSLAMSEGRLFAGTYYSGVFTSTNNGTTWASASSGLKSNYVNSLAESQGKLFAGTYNGVFMSVNNGQSWHSLNEGLTDTLIISLAVNGSYLFAGTHSEGVWRLPLQEVAANLQQHRSHDKRAVVLNIPRRMRVGAKIDYTLPHSDHVRIALHDLTGRMIATLVDNRFDAGTHCLHWHKTKLSAGCYAIKMQTTSRTLVRITSIP